MPFIDFDDPSARLNLLETLEPRSDPANPIVEEVRALLKLPGCLATSDQQRILDYFHQCLGERGIESLFRRAQPFAEQSSSLPKRSIKAAEASPTPVPPINSEERERLYQQFISEKSQKVLAHLESHDRGLAISPMGLRDILGKVLTRLIEGGLSPRFKTLLQKKMVLIVQGKENQERWRKRLEGIFGERRQVGHHQQVLWEKNGVQVQLATIHELSRLPRPDLKMFMDDAGLVILDKEHHVRPVEDRPEDPDRKRFARVLIEAGLLTEDFQAQSQEGKCLLSFTETVSGGAKQVYRGKEGLIFSETLPELLARGFIKKPEVRAILPKGFTGETPVHEAWKALSLEERVEASLTSIRTVDEELNRGKPPRIVVYAGSREEAESLAQHLEANPRYHHQTALMISGDQETEKRRVEEGKEFFDGTRAIAIHVETLVEGVDEFQKRPVDAVIFSGAERAGGLRYALQSVGAHLISGEKPPLFIDQAGMFLHHPDLMAFNPELYLIEEGKMRKGSPLATLPSRPRTRGKEVLKEVDILTIDIFGEGIGKNISRFLEGEAKGISRSAIALELGWSEEIVLKILKGEFLPQSRAMMEKFAQALNLNISDQAQLLNEWAIDRMRYYEQFHPTPEHLSDQERVVLRGVRRGLILHYGGRWEPKSIPLNRYLETGGWPELINHKRELAKTLAQIVYGSSKIKEGWEFLRKNLKGSFLVEVWTPTTLEEVRETTSVKLEGWFKAVEQELGKPVQEIVLQFHLVKGKLQAFQLVAVGMEKGETFYGKIIIRRRKGKTPPYEIVMKSTKGGGVADFIESLRKAKGLKDVLEIRSNGWMIDNTPLTLEEMEDCRKEDLERWFEEVARKTKSNPQEIVIQFRLTKGKLVGFQPFAEGMKNEDTAYGKITIRRKGKSHYEIYYAKHSGATKFLEQIQKSSLTQGENPILEITDEALRLLNDREEIRRERMSRGQKARRARRPNPESGFSTLEILSLGTAKGIEKISPFVYLGARSVGSNALIFGIGEYGSNWVTGHKNPGFWELKDSCGFFQLK